MVVFLQLVCPAGFPGGTSGKEPTSQCRRRKRCGFDPWVGKISWERAWQLTPVFLPGKCNGQRSWWAMVHRVTKSWTWLKRLSSSSVQQTRVLCASAGHSCVQPPGLFHPCWAYVHSFVPAGRWSPQPPAQESLDHPFSLGSWLLKPPGLLQTFKNPRAEMSKAGVPNLWDLMPDDLRGNWCNNNRNKVHNKCNVLESSWKHPPTTPVHGKTVLHETSPWCQKGWGPLV